MPILEEAVIFLGTAVFLVPLFRRLKLGAVLGYLAAGALIGPWGLRLIADVATTLQFAELGVVLLLFLVGLELEPSRLWALRRPVFGFGGAQVLVTGVVLGLLGKAFGLSWQASIIAGAGLAMSSTALVLSSLGERGELETPHGRASFAILLFQDLSVIPLLALLPLLSGEGAQGSGGWIAAAKGLAAIVTVIVASRVIVRPVLKQVARWGGQEVFTAAALLVVIGSAVLMEAIGLSMSLGAFLAGVLLADSEFRHELSADVEPFKGLLLGLFFIAVGMSANLSLLLVKPVLVVGLAVGLMATKAALLTVILRFGRLSAETAQRVGVLLAQGGEFAFVLFAAAGASEVFTAQTSQLLVLVVTVSMLLAPLTFAIHERLLARWLERTREPEFDVIDGPGNPVIIAGYGRFGQIISRVLRMSGIGFTVLEASYQQVDFVRKFGAKVYYGDASRLDLLQSARAAQAKLFVLAIDDVEASMRAANVMRRHFPHVPILARARNRVHYFALRDLGAEVIERETFAASLLIAREALMRTGFDRANAERTVAMFEQHDREQLDVQYAVHHDEEKVIQTSMEAAAQLRELFEADAASRAADNVAAASVRAA
ncbi:MAG: monovalent cation:proton antiporter-2 (CPA2) family protein [Pseudomonadota bacterium]|nr:monovalent cation:proton antiporter-2 (CPA2) family protein [Pseudomonadota bacterium]